MTKYTKDEKSHAVLEYLEGKKTYKSIAQERNVSLSPLKGWVARYLEHGMEGLASSYTNYTLPFKLEVLTYMNENGASISATAVHYNLPSDSTLLNWANQLKEGGIDALKPKKKGRLSMKKETKKTSPAKGSQEALLAELEYLRAENAYPAFFRFRVTTDTLALG
ncbi:transposase [Peribacillus sp. NPDC006672]|uniref:transposase n=1 Tax=Peribacillus sp. NPDC006672 TaxID=3390606 RepID=UPI003D08EF40